MLPQVPDEEEIKSKAQQIEVEYEKKMQKMTAELAEARASSERTAAEMDKLKAEAEAKQRQLYTDFTLQAQAERVQLKQHFDAEMERVQCELESTRRSKEVVQMEIDSLRNEYKTAMFSVENLVPPEQLDAERERLREEYETKMKMMRDELDAVKTSRANVEAEIEDLKADYEARLRAGKSVMMVASKSTSTALVSNSNDSGPRHQNLTDEMKIVSVEGLQRAQIDEPANVTSSVVEQRQSGSDQIRVKLLKDTLDKYSASDQQETVVASSVSEPSSPDAEQLDKNASSSHENAVSTMKSELENLKRSRDELAKVIYRIKTEYQDAVRRAEETVPSHRFEDEKLEIRETYERQMERVKDGLQVLKSCRNIVTLQLAEQNSVWKVYEEERQKIDEDVEDGRVERETAPELIEVAARRYFEETRRLCGTAAADKENVQTKVVSERFEREKRHVEEDVDDGKLTETEAVNLVDKLIEEKTAGLNAIREQAKNGASTVVEDVDQEMNVNRKSSSSMPRTMSRSRSSSSQREGEAYDVVARRLKTLEDIIIEGGRDVTRAAGTNSDTELHHAIREKLRRERLNAEERQHRLQEAHKSTEGLATAHDELDAKKMALERLRSQNQNLQREIIDIQAMFSFSLVYSVSQKVAPLKLFGIFSLKLSVFP